MIVKIRNVNYHVEITGKGPPLLLLHGFTGSAENWKEFKEIWKEYQLISLDIIGHGQTDSPHTVFHYDMMKMVEDLNELLKKLGIESVHILGYSMGGRLALSFAMTYKNRVKSLILESSSPGLKTEQERSERRKSDEKLAAYIQEAGVMSFVDKWENIPLFKSQKELPSHYQQSIRSQRLKNDPVGLANSLLGMGTGSQPSWWNMLSHLFIPVLLVCGQKDEKFCRIAFEMADRLPKRVIKKVNGAGHAIHVERPQIFGTIVDEFLSAETHTKGGSINGY
ncbi:2-succinyl-6-hydroxy-2,4-cyclohexadiene-1-carboxylate synthase [Metabacillus arenae]|uniref:Putative 2-succinyl-6-hydroxy-2,4-cyclohexadiene-1-carboxylate synthase n=1 Tax=Metabacillus arenae TaxID=2771434 RepID=A0A926NGA2_9BACI|nr:2-succinyl-6-hydroxy-2,4-cyclohexadiene-1-carboxylate synthase [Metabacillus arenae]MBD1380265.1 2-succinyl-6-hydroxy-2,4-cyclohexadiene-1-carboxylate synthase [Metabacillus arenae]